MYFKEKGNTNIDSEFNSNKKFDLKNLKPILFVVGGIVLLVIIICIIMSFRKNSNKYTLELLGEETITLTVGDDYVEPGYKAYDKHNKDYTSNVEITSTINTSKVGKYEIVYSIGKIQKIRSIEVKEKIDATYIHLKGETSVRLKIGDKYIEPGYEAYDSIDRELTNKVKVSGTVNTSKPGVYQLRYSVVNSRNVTTTVTRNVIVAEK